MTIFAKPTSVLDWLKFLAMAFAAVMLVSWIAGQVRDWRAPKPPVTPPVVRGHVDPGTPAPGPVNEAPTVPIPLTVAVPDLTPEEVAAFMKKYGLQAKDAPTPGRRGTQGQPTTPDAAPAPPSSQPRTEPPAAPGVSYPIPLAEERFSFKGVPGIAIDVSAAQLEPGGRVVLNGTWLPYQAPAVAEPKRGWLGNEAKWVWTAGPAMAHTADGTGYGALIDVGYRGWRTNRLTWGVDAVIVPVSIGGQLKMNTGLVALTASYEKQ